MLLIKFSNIILSISFKEVTMKDHFTIWGFKINTRKFMLTLGISAGVLLVLVLLNAFVVDISWYGVIIGTGFLVALWLATKLAEYRDLPSDLPYDLILWVFPFSIVGARTYYVVTSLDEFANFGEMIAVWNGGMAIYGGIIGGLIGLIICCLIKKKNIVDTMDLACPCLIIAQSIGRWGNFINQEVYGWEVTNKAWQWFPFAVKIGNSWHLATFFYESILNLGGFFLLTHLLRKHRDRGLVSSCYLVFYGTVRLILEGLREDAYILKIPHTNLAVSQVVSGVIIIIGLAWLTLILIRRRKERSAKI